VTRVTPEHLPVKRLEENPIDVLENLAQVHRIVEEVEQIDAALVRDK